MSLKKSILKNHDTYNCDYVTKKDVEHRQIYLSELYNDNDKYSVLLDKLKYLNTYTFEDTKNELYSFLYSDETPINIKLIIGLWLYKKIAIYFYPMKNEVEDKCNILIKCINTWDKDIIGKGSYLRYTNRYAIEHLIKHFYFNRHDDKYFIIQMLNDMKLMDINDPYVMKDHFIEWITKINIFEQRSNLLDVLLKYFPGDEKIKNIYEEMKWNNKDEKTIYNNSQNAHDENKTLQSVKLAEKLYKKIKEFDLANNIECRDMCAYIFDFFNDNYNYTDICKTVLTRITIDTSVYGFESFFNLLELTYSLIKFILMSEYKDELIKRLYEEMIEMKDLCATGYLNRYINVLQGFHPEYEVKMEFESQLNASINFYLSKKILEENNDDITLGSYDEKYKDLYISFVKKHVNMYIPSLMSQYGEKDVMENIVHVLTKITNSKWFLDGRTICSR